MAFSYTTIISNEGNKIVQSGVYTNTSGSTGGDISAKMQVVEFVTLQPKGSAVATAFPVYNETLPLRGTAVTIVTSSNEVGCYRFTGH